MRLTPINSRQKPEKAEKRQTEKAEKSVKV
jgi:hypothetical protein